MKNFGGPVVRDFTHIFFCLFAVLSFSEMDEDGMLIKITFTLSDKFTASVVLYV